MNILFILISLIFCFGGRINVSASQDEGEGEGEAVAIVTVIHPNAVTVTFDPVAGKIIESTQIQLKEKEDSSPQKSLKLKERLMKRLPFPFHLNQFFPQVVSQRMLIPLSE